MTAAMAFVNPHSMFDVWGLVRLGFSPDPRETEFVAYVSEN